MQAYLTALDTAKALLEAPVRTAMVIAVAMVFLKVLVILLSPVLLGYLFGAAALAAAVCLVANTS